MATSISPTKFGAIYLFVQSFLTSVWWAGMILHPEWRSWFFAAPDVELGWAAFLIPDVVLYIGAGLVAAIGLMTQRPFGWPVLLIHLGAVGFASLHAVAQSMILGRGWLGAVSMCTSFIFGCWLAWRLRPI